MPETDFDRFKQELEKQLQPINEAISKIMHPETGFYPQITEVRNISKRAHERVDENLERLRRMQHLLYGNGSPGLADDVREIKEQKKKTVAIAIGLALPIYGYVIPAIINNFFK